MPRQFLKFRTPERELVAGDVPLVVGTLSAIPEGFDASTQDIPSDLVEIRLDKMPAGTNWLTHARSIQSRGIPVILTIRLKAEGGEWLRPDSERLPLYREATEHLSTVDVELNSSIARAVADAAKQSGKLSIISFHDFDKTPPLAELQTIVSK